MADVAVQQGWKIDAVLNNDMIGNIHGINGVIDNTSFRVFSEPTPVTETERERQRRRVTGGEGDGPPRQLARYVARIADEYFTNLDAMMVYRLDRFGRGGHHRPFNDRGFPGVRIMETNENYNRQHQDLRTENGVEYGDVIEWVDFDYAAKLTGVNAAVLASLAWAPAPPQNVRISGAVRPSTTLQWEASPAPNVAGYKVYWRLTTEPQWTHWVWAGNVTEHTLENVVIDNYLFGVAAVAPAGNESVVVFPGSGRGPGLGTVFTAEARRALRVLPHTGHGGRDEACGRLTASSSPRPLRPSGENNNSGRPLQQAATASPSRPPVAGRTASPPGRSARGSRPSIRTTFAAPHPTPGTRVRQSRPSRESRPPVR